MPLISLLLNILWVVTGGIWMAAGWLLAAMLMVVTIVGIPWARSALTIAWYTLLPFGQTAVRRDEFRGREDIGTGLLGTLGNVVWFVLAGWWLALGHLVIAVPLALSIIGLPFAWAHLKLAALALWPVGTQIVTTEEAEVRRRLAMGGRA
ncbi:YccF domain-containing protein [Azospirillum sp. sgz302134]